MRRLRKLFTNLASVARVSGLRTAAAYSLAMVMTLPRIVRRRTLVPADQRMAKGRWIYRLQGAAITLDGRHFSGAREMYCRQVYFPDGERILRPGMTVVDLGANTGLFSLLAAHAGCRVIAVEAQWGFVQEAGALAREQGVGDRVTIEHGLVGAHGGKVSDAATLESASHFQGRHPVAMSMAELFEKHGLERVDFVKIDIEGSEFDLFASDSDWLARVDRLAMEVHPEFGAVSALVAVLRRHRFVMELRDESLRPAGEPTATYLHARRETPAVAPLAPTGLA